MFFKDIADYKKFIPVMATFPFSNIQIYLEDVDRTVLKKYLGKDLLGELQELFDDAENIDAVDDDYKDLLKLLRQCTANLAMAKWITIGQVNISGGSITIQSNAEQKTAFQWQIKDIEDRCNEVGMNALEEALEYLEQNIADDLWGSYLDSDEFKENRYLFVSSGKEFSKYFSSFDSSRINFYKLRSAIRKVEDFEIKAVLLPELFDDLKDKLQSGETIGELSQILLDKIKPIVVNMVIAKGINDLAISVDAKGIMNFDNTGGRQTIESKKHAPDNTLARIADGAEQDGLAYKQLLAEYLEENKDDYPLFKNSTKYTAPADDVELNDGEKPFFIGM